MREWGRLPEAFNSKTDDFNEEMFSKRLLMVATGVSGEAAPHLGERGEDSLLK